MGAGHIAISYGVNVSELILLLELLFREMVLYSWMWKTHNLDHFFGKPKIYDSDLLAPDSPHHPSFMFKLDTNVDSGCDIYVL